jgi:hypothetical protein
VAHPEAEFGVASVGHQASHPRRLEALLQHPRQLLEDQQADSQGVLDPFVVVQGREVMMDECI